MRSAGGVGAASEADGGGASGGTRPVGGSSGQAAAGRGGSAAGEAGNAGEGGAGNTGGSGSGATSGTAARAGDAGAGGAPEPCGATRSCIGSFARRSARCERPARDDGTATPTHPPDCPDDYTYSECSVEALECETDVECGAQSYCIFSRNIYYEPYGAEVRHLCLDSCEADDDCDAGSICECRPRIKDSTREEVSLGTCRAAGCSADDDCADGFSCISPKDDLGTDQGLFHCQTAEDECSGVEDCPEVPDDDCEWRRVCKSVAGRFVCERHSHFSDCELGLE